MEDPFNVCWGSVRLRRDNRGPSVVWNSPVGLGLFCLLSACPCWVSYYTIYYTNTIQILYKSSLGLFCLLSACPCWVSYYTIYALSAACLPMLRGVSYTQYAFDAFETLHCIESESSAAKSHQKKSPQFERNPRRTCSVSPPLMLLTAATLSLGNFSQAGLLTPVWKCH